MPDSSARLRRLVRRHELAGEAWLTAVRRYRAAGGPLDTDLLAEKLIDAMREAGLEVPDLD